MIQFLDTHHCLLAYSPTTLLCKSKGFNGKCVQFKKHGVVQSSLRANSSEMVTAHITDRCSLPYKVKDDDKNVDVFCHVRCLSEFKDAELMGKIVMVRFDSNVLLGEKQDQRAISTVKYLYEAGAKVILTSSWSVKPNSKFSSADSVSAYLSSILKLRVVPMKFVPGHEQPKMKDCLNSSIFLLENLSQFKEELANSSRFSEELSSGVDIFVNDAFFQSHKILASTVGITSFCYASVAGFHFEEQILQLKNAFGTKRYPYIAMCRLVEVTLSKKQLPCII